MDLETLRALDAAGYRRLEALTHDRPPPGSSLANPHAFVCSDGATYWVKSSSQQGLLAELIAGRLADMVSVGPIAQVVNVSTAAHPDDGSASHLLGELVGIVDFRETVNGRDLHVFMANGRFQPDAVQARSRAEVVVFQTWVGAHDPQVLLNLGTGRVSSIDHGDCFGNLSDDLPSLVVTQIPGVDDGLGREASLVADMVTKVQAVSDEHLLKAVAAVPRGPEWRSEDERRLTIAKWLARRRDSLEGVIRAWVTP